MIQHGDSLYVRANGGPMVGRVLCHGKSGVTVECDGRRVQVPWSDVLGRKESVTTRAKVIDEGIDGAIIEHDDGRRAYVRGLRMPDPSGPVKAPGIWERLEMTKALVLFAKGGIKERPGLRLEEVTDRGGHRVKRWKKTDTGASGRGRQEKADPEEVRGSGTGYGTHHISPGDSIKFETNEYAGGGKISAVGKDGVTVADANGREHKVLWAEVRDHTPGGDSVGAQKTKYDTGRSVLGSQKPVPADQFVAADYAKSHDHSDVTPEVILAHFPEDTKEKIAEAQQRLASVEQTIEQYQKDGTWVEERQKLHREIVGEILSPERIKAATPPEGESPSFIILGGRGGSGKSSFAGLVYDPDKFIVLDADHIKGMLPEYEGWNAHQVHEESGEIFDNMVRMARSLGLNVVLDKTMKTAKSAVADVKAFKDAGYRAEAHYMHLPRQESAKRAVSRFLNGGKTGRYVPVEVILKNTTNEESFDHVKDLVDAWSFRDNNVARGDKPLLISESGSRLKKSVGGPILVLWRQKR